MRGKSVVVLRIVLTCDEHVINVTIDYRRLENLNLIWIVRRLECLVSVMMSMRVVVMVMTMISRAATTCQSLTL